MMIEKLTKKQERSMAEFRRKWIARAIRTDWDPDAAKAAVPDIYRAGGLKPPEQIICVPDPPSAMKVISRLKGKKKVEWTPPDDGAGWCGWRAFYDFFDFHFCLCEKLRPYLRMDTTGAFWYWWFDRAAILMGPPSVFQFSQGDLDGTVPYVLHCDGAPAVEWPGGESPLWFLNGVSVPQWLAETKAEKIDPARFAKIENAEVRREFIRKVGVERLCQKLQSKILDTDGDYELHLIDLKGDTGEWPYLKMLNPSIGTWHMEAVDASCQTVKEAIRWRNQSDLVPEKLT